MMIVAQSLAQLRGAYGNDGAQNFLANCRLQLFMAPADSETPDYVSKAIGNFTRKSRSKSWMMGQIGKSNIQEREEGARLLRTEDLRSLSSEDCVLLIQDSDPVRAQKVLYYEDRFLTSIFEDQKGEWPDVNVLSTQVRKAVDAQSSKNVDVEITQDLEHDEEDDDEINAEDFEVMKSNHEALLDAIKSVKNRVGV